MKKRDNTNLLVDKLLKDSKEMTPAKIKAFADVIGALKGHEPPGDPTPNTLKDEPNSQELTEDMPMDFSSVQNVELEGVKGSRRKITIHKEPKV